MPRWLGNILSTIFGPFIYWISGGKANEEERKRTDPDNDGSTG